MIQERKNSIYVDAESLSLDDKFLQYMPKTENQENTLNLIKEAITKKVRNFYLLITPSFNEDHTGIVAEFGRKPAVGESLRWWIKAAKAYCPERNSRLGTKLEYGAFLGVLIKKIHKSGFDISEAWSMVCSDSSSLGHYWNSPDFKHNLEPTGSRYMFGFYDLANTFKLFMNGDETSGFLLASGSFDVDSCDYPIGEISEIDEPSCPISYTTGWIVHF